MRVQLAHALLDVLLAFVLLAYARGADPACVGEGCECARWCKLPDDHCPNEACRDCAMCDAARPGQPAAAAAATTAAAAAAAASAAQAAASRRLHAARRRRQHRQRGGPAPAAAAHAGGGCEAGAEGSALMCSHNGDASGGIGTLSAWGMPEDLPKFALYFAPVGLVFGIAAGAWAHSREQSKKKTKKQLESEFEEKRRRSGARSAGFDDDDDDDFD